jgi:hypothetical protein
MLLADWIAIKPTFFTSAGEFQSIFLLGSPSFYHDKLSVKC